MKKGLILTLVAALMVGVFSFVPSKAASASEVMSQEYGTPKPSFDWEKLGDRYYYYNLPAAEKRVWDGLYNVCSNLLYSEKDAELIEFSDGSTGYYTAEVPADGVDRSGLSMLIHVFSNSNPQFYFLGPSIVTVSGPSGLRVQANVYDELANGKVRGSISDQLMVKLKDLIAQVETESGTMAKVKKAAQIISDLALYDKPATESGGSGKHQTIYSILFEGKTVCAGFSELYAAVLKAVGIDCLTIENETHEWNLVRIGDYWYNVCVTGVNNDNDPSKLYFDTFFGRSDQNLIATQKNNTQMYVRDQYYTKLKAPRCDYDYGEAPEDSGKPYYKDAPVYYLFNKATGEHLYTIDKREWKSLSGAGWTDYGQVWTAPSSPFWYLPVFRLFNPASGEHHYTRDLSEIKALSDKGWVNEGAKFNTFSGDGTPVYRIYNSGSPGVGSHYYTANAAEKDVLLSQNSALKDEGICWYGR